MQNEKGFTLIEVLASMTILFIILISFFSIFTQSALFTRTNEESLEGTNLADLVMEIVRAELLDEEAGQHLERLGLVGCTLARLEEEGCQTEDSLTVKLTELASDEMLELTMMRIEVFSNGYQIARRQFYLGGTVR